MLPIIYERLKNYQPKTVQSSNGFAEAAVLVPIIKKTAPELLLTLRAANLAVHSGEVSFPGGGREEADHDLIQTAFRESEEEIALKRDNIEIIGALSTQISHHRIHVTPYVGLISDHLSYEINESEVERIFTVPLEFFANPPHDYTQRTDIHGVDYYIPRYHYNDFKIWGLTAMMIVELVNLLYDANISLTQKPKSMQS